jgi:hypothetical protein
MITTGSAGEHVKVVQRLLNQALNVTYVTVDGVFGQQTRSAVKLFQRQNNLVPDGVIGPKTRELLQDWDDMALSPRDITIAAKSLGIDERLMRAIVSVESRGNGFLSDGRPVILYERHIMRRRLISIMPLNKVDDIISRSPSLVNSSPGNYFGGIREWGRLEAAMKIHEESALESTSWGLFQIMGFHHARLGYSGIHDFVEKMKTSARDQFEAFLRFVETDQVLLSAMRELDFQRIARLYNGPNFHINQYDKKLKEHFYK